MSPVLTLGNFISTRSALLSLLLLDASIYCPFNFLLFDLLSFTFCWLRQELLTQSCAIEIHTQQYTQPAIQYDKPTTNAKVIVRLALDEVKNRTDQRTRRF